MARWRAEVVGAGWLEITGNFYPEIEVFDVDDATAALPGGTTLSYTLKNQAGATVETATGTLVSGLANTIRVGTALSADLDPTVLYLENWSGTIASQPIHARREARASNAPLRFSPITTANVLRAHPDLTDYPGTQTSWQPQIDRSWSRVLTRLVAQTKRADIWTPGMLAPVAQAAALADIYRSMATFVGGPWLDFAAQYDARTEAEWRALRLWFDDDGDGDLDSPPESVGASHDWAGLPPLERR